MFFGEINSICTGINSKFHNMTYQPDGVEVIDEDWDNLILLDGCRYDYFSELNTIDGQLESRTSRGSTSIEFIRQNFTDESLHDTIYITANPYAIDLSEDTFFKIVDLLETHWDTESETVFPDDVVDVTLDIYDQYPDKRLIIHFMQPHCPFIGKKGKQINHRGFQNKTLRADVEGYSVWDIVRYGLSDISEQTVREAYIENLKLVLDSVRSLLSDLAGKSVISADHGNLLGDRMFPLPVKGWGHPKYVRSKELTEVPWFVVDHAERRKVRAEPPERYETMHDSVVEDRLKSFGYL